MHFASVVSGQSFYVQVKNGQNTWGRVCPNRVRLATTPQKHENFASCNVFTARPNLAQNLKCNHCAAFVSLLLHVIRPVQQRQLATQKTHSPDCWRKSCGTQFSTVLQTYKGSSAQIRDTWFHDKKSNRV